MHKIRHNMQFFTFKRRCRAPCGLLASHWIRHWRHRACTKPIVSTVVLWVTPSQPVLPPSSFSICYGTETLGRAGTDLSWASCPSCPPTRMSELCRIFFQNMQNIEMCNMRQTYEEIGRDRIFLTSYV